MKLTTSILTVTAAMMTSGAWAQNPNIINNVQSSMNTVQAQKTSDSNAALGITAKPAAAQSAKPAASQPIKPAAAQPAKPAASQPANTAATATAKPATATPATAKPATAKAETAKPATSTTAAPGKSPFVAVKASAKPQVDPMVKKKPASNAVIVAKEPTLQVVSKTASPDGKNAADANAAGAVKPIEAPKPEEKKWAMSGKRDPFFSPVVQQPTGSGCATGKKCLDIGQINLRGVVRSESGFIAVVTNSLNKAYFLHENDPVFNGYVMKITGDSVVFSESGQDKLGKPLMREVVKKITTPAV
ncbi:MAG: hypothetical protein WAN65_12560 [Candidatus Sulfotelmatobacter sp.]